LRNLRFHQSTQEDIDLLNIHIDIILSNQLHLSIIIRYHNLRDIINNHYIQEVISRTGVIIRYYRVIIINLKNISLSIAYNMRYDPQILSNDILPLIPGYPLMIIKNINPILDIS
jgi:hypothetical protein